MNIFVTSKCPKQSAKNLDDKRVVKMCAESAQILSTALNLVCRVPVDQLPCKPTHQNHPCNIWARSSRSNYLWLVDHFEALCKEKKARYPDKPDHIYFKHVEFFRNSAMLLGDIGLTKFANCAANKSLGLDYTMIEDVTLAYQMYLNDRWDTDKRAPTWYKEFR